jgi:sugar fermentation stimulation protein A
MRFARSLVQGRLVRRYKRFLADVMLPDGSTVTAHCANPAAMLGLAHPGSAVLLQPAGNPARKLAYDWEIEFAVGPDGVQPVGINTANPNRIAAEAIAAGAIPGLAGYASCRPEVPYGAGSRVDFLLEGPDRPACLVEVKNVHLLRRSGLAEFPDSVTARGAKHLAELARAVAGGRRAVMLYVIQMRARAFRIAGDLDPAYAAAFAAARAAGVEAIACTCRVSAEEIVIDGEVPVEE